MLATVGVDGKCQRAQKVADNCITEAAHPLRCASCVAAAARLCARPTGADPRSDTPKLRSETKDDQVTNEHVVGDLSVASCGIEQLTGQSNENVWMREFRGV